MWKGGSEPRLLTPFPRDNRDPRDPGENSEIAQNDVKIDTSASSTLLEIAMVILSCAQVRWLERVTALPCRRQHVPHNFRWKNRYVLDHFFPGLVKGSPIDAPAWWFVHPISEILHQMGPEKRSRRKNTAVLREISLRFFST